MEINGVLILWLPDTVFALGLDTYHWLSSFASRHVSDFPTWVKVGDRRASGILSGPLSTSCYLGFSINLRYRAISTTVFLRFTDFIGDKSPKLSTNGVRRIVDIRWRSVPDSLRRKDFVTSWSFLGDQRVSNSVNVTGFLCVVDWIHRRPPRLRYFPDNGFNFDFNFWFRSFFLRRV